MIERYLKHSISFVIFIVPIYIYFNPPQDRDAGPMMAYSLLFFPLLFLSILFSIIILFSSILNFKSNKIENSLLIISTFPTIILLVLGFAHF